MPACVCACVSVRPSLCLDICLSVCISVGNSLGVDSVIETGIQLGEGERSRVLGFVRVFRFEFLGVLLQEFPGRIVAHRGFTTDRRPMITRMRSRTGRCRFCAHSEVVVATVMATMVRRGKWIVKRIYVEKTCVNSSLDYA